MSTTTTAYGSTVEAKWADIEQRIRDEARPLPRTEDDPGFWAVVRALNEAKADGVRPVWLSRASVDIEPTDRILEPVFDFEAKDLGYKLTPIHTKKGEAIVIEVMHTNDGRTTKGEPILGRDGTPIPFVTTKAWVVPPSPEYDTIDFLTELQAAYNDLCRHGDRGMLQSAEAQADRQAAQDDADLKAAGLYDLFGSDAPAQRVAPQRVTIEDVF